MNRISASILFFVLTFPLLSKTANTLRGEDAYARGEYNQALSLFKLAIEEGETRGEPWFFIGNIYESQRKFTESISYFVQAADRKMPTKYKKATLWKLVIFYSRFQQYQNLLTYANRLENLGVNVSKFRQQAEENLSRDSIKVQNSIEAAQKLEKNQAEPIELAKAYEDIYLLDQNLIDAAWKAALYYEKAASWRKARNLYESIYAQKTSLKAKYKIGFTARKQEDWEGSYDALNQVYQKIKSEKKTSKLAYFTQANLMQVEYARQNYFNSQKMANFAQSLAKNLSLNKNSLKNANLVECLALTHPRIDHLDKIDPIPQAMAKEQEFASNYQNHCKKLLSQPPNSLIGLFQYRHYTYVAPSSQANNKTRLNVLNKWINQNPQLPSWAFKEVIDLISTLPANSSTIKNYTRQFSIFFHDQDFALIGQRYAESRAWREAYEAFSRVPVLTKFRLSYARALAKLSYFDQLNSIAKEPDLANAIASQEDFLDFRKWQESLKKMKTSPETQTESIDPKPLFNEESPTESIQNHPFNEKPTQNPPKTSPPTTHPLKIHTNSPTEIQTESTPQKSTPETQTRDVE